MGKNKHYCDYCDVLLTHNSIAVRKAHNAGRNHLANVRDYYQQALNENPPLTQSIFDGIMKHYEEAQVPPPPEATAMGPPSMLFGSGPLSGQGPNMFGCGPPGGGGGYGGPSNGYSRGPPPGYGGGGGGGYQPRMGGGPPGGYQNGPPPGMMNGPPPHMRGPPPGMGGPGGPPPGGMPNFSQPPPNFSQPPPNFSQPPPTFSQPPPGFGGR
ncbi:U1 small nuclear ribonucleoprotein C [Tilletia horrida]|nr:U1 small nuclear ribonucleoprotein C [Tilletia horrida]